MRGYLKIRAQHTMKRDAAARGADIDRIIYLGIENMAESAPE